MNRKQCRLLMRYRIRAWNSTEAFQHFQHVMQCLSEKTIYGNNNQLDYYCYNFNNHLFTFGDIYRWLIKYHPKVAARWNKLKAFL